MFFTVFDFRLAITITNIYSFDFQFFSHCLILKSFCFYPMNFSYCNYRKAVTFDYPPTIGGLRVKRLARDAPGIMVGAGVFTKGRRDAPGATRYSLAHY